MATAAVLKRIARAERHPKLRSDAAKLTPKEAKRRAAARENLLDFIKYVTPSWKPSWHHVLLCKKIQAWADTPGARLIVSMPPQHGKSEIISRHLPAWLLGRDPDAGVMLCSYGARLANGFNRKVQRLVKTAAYQELFPGTQLPRPGKGEGARQADLFEVAGRTGSLRTAGVGGSITGMGYKYGLIDDPTKGRAEAESPTKREAAWGWYAGDFYTRRSPDARILVVATRWHEEDLPGRLLRLSADDPAADTFEEVRLQAVAGPDRPEGDPRAEGEALWPERYPLANLAKARALSEYDWHALYQQDPRQGMHSEWPPAHFTDSVYFSEWPDLAVTGIAIDPSKGAESKPGDYCGIVFGGYDGRGGLWVDAVLERLSAEQVVTRTVDVFADWPCDVVAVETNMFQTLLCAPMAEEARKRKLMLPIQPLENFVPKPVRIRRLGPHLAAHNIHVRATPGGRLLLKQLRQFPLSDHDDGPDALEMLLRVLINLWNGGKKRGK